MECYSDRIDWHNNKSLLSEAPTLIKPITSSRSSRPEVFCKKGVLRNFAKLTGKHLCQSPLFNKVAGSAATLFLKKLWRRCFTVNFTKFLRAPFFYRTLPVTASDLLIVILKDFTLLSVKLSTKHFIKFFI